jgi:cell fate regulator YaaT (PSP1 superfamily)
MEEKQVVGVRFKRAGRIYFFDPAGIDLDVKDHVVVESEHGLNVGKVAIAPKQVIASELTEPLKPVTRKATPEDMELHESQHQKEEDALSRCQELASKYNVPIMLLDAESNLDGSYLTIFFSAEGRVDFRQLVRELAASLKTRVELHQVGPRDKTKLMGGIGKCGYPLCCGTFLTEFSPLSIRIAKEQNLSLEPAKISGICGRLLCCLGYERDFYHAMKEKLPSVGQQVVTPLGEGRVTGVSPLKEVVTVQMESEVRVELPAADVTKKEGGEGGKKRSPKRSRR